MSTQFNYDEKNEKFEKLLDKLSNNISSEESYREIIDLFSDYSKVSNVRFSYSFLTGYVLEKNSNESSFEERFQLIADNLFMIFYLVKEDEKYKETELPKFVYKLMDHANLELIRLGYFEKNFIELSTLNASLEEKYRESATQYEELTKKYDENSKLSSSLSERYQKIAYRINSINKNVNSQRNQYITILGIFASIVITVFAGLSISSSIITSVHNSAVAKLCFFSCLTGFIVFNILVALFCFLTKINNIGLGNKYWILVIVFNIFMIIGAFGSIWAAFSVPVSDIGFSFFFKSTP